MAGCRFLQISRSIEVFPVPLAPTKATFSHVVELDQLKRNILVLGAGRSALNIAHRMRRKSDRRGFRIAGYINLNEVPPQVDSSKVLKLNQPLYEYVSTHHIDQIVVAHTGAYLNVRAIPTELTGLDGHSADIFSMLTISRSSGNPIRHMSTHNISVIQKSDTFEHITEPTSDLEGQALALKRPITLPQGGAVYLEASSNNSSGETGLGSVKIIWREIEI